MGQDVPDVNLLPIVVNHCDEAVLVAGDVEHRESGNLIRSAE